MLRRKDDSADLPGAPAKYRARSATLKKPSLSRLAATKRKPELDIPSSKEQEIPAHAHDGSPPAKTRITLTLNGAKKQIAVAPWTTLLDALREYMDLTGTKKGCDHGQCGACTVLVDGKRILSCLTLAIMQDGADVTTVEGLAEGDTLHALQQAFIEHDAFQCGYCTPGQICSAVGLIREGKAKTADDIRELMSGNLCRCGAYPNILAAIQQVMQNGKRRAR
jgi:xanthine dehydrogenase YagT iron-sulfur-binding subunit